MSLSEESFPNNALLNSDGDNNPGFLTFLFRSLVSMANDPTNTKYFFPIFLSNLQVNGEPLVPFVTTMDLGKVQSLEAMTSRYVCQNGWASYNNYGPSEASGPPLLKIKSATFNGLNNAAISNFITDPPTQDLQYPVIFTANFNAYSNYANLGIDPGSFYFNISCQTDDGVHSEELPANGTFTASFKQPIFTLVLLLSFNDDLTVTVTIPNQYTPYGSTAPIAGLQMSFGPSGGLKISNITVTADPNIQAAIENLAKTAFSQQSTLNMIIGAFNQNIIQPGTTGDIANAISDKLNGLINNLK